MQDVIDQLRVSESAATSGINDDVRIDADKPDVEIDVKDDTGNAIRRGADATKNGVERAGEATADAAKKAGRATVDGAKKVGEKVRDAVTDDDKDSDKDGK